MAVDALQNRGFDIANKQPIQQQRNHQQRCNAGDQPAKVDRVANQNRGNAVGCLLGEPEKGAQVQTSPGLHLHTAVHAEQRNEKLSQKANAFI